jgi:hypothetical protein
MPQAHAISLAVGATPNGGVATEPDLEFNGSGWRELNMSAKARGFAAIFAAMMLFAPSAFAQGLKKGSHAAPTYEERPAVDEKAYNSALERIPAPKKPYDPWGQVHDSGADKSSKK